jgi:hypothetical protein
VNPLIVIVNADDEPMDAPNTVMIKEISDVALHSAERPETLLAPAATNGMTDDAKKLEG